MIKMTRFHLDGRVGQIQAALGLYPEAILAERGRQGAQLVVKHARAEEAKAAAEARRAARNAKRRHP